MSTLLLRLAAPLQSWGIAKFERRGTEIFPTKSGVLGMIAAALGRRRNDSLSDLQELRFGARADRRGSLLRDYHTAKHPTDDKRKYVTNRYYLSDAVFLVGLEGDDGFLDEINLALSSPAFPLFLGRRSCPPEGRLSLGIREKSLRDALRDEDWLVSDWNRKHEEPFLSLRIIVDADDGESNAFFQRDIPDSFDQQDRRYSFRRVFEIAPLQLSNPASSRWNKNPETDHDPMSMLGGNGAVDSLLGSEGADAVDSLSAVADMVDDLLSGSEDFKTVHDPLSELEEG